MVGNYDDRCIEFSINKSITGTETIIDTVPIHYEGNLGLELYYLPNTIKCTTTATMPRENYEILSKKERLVFENTKYDNGTVRTDISFFINLETCQRIKYYVTRTEAEIIIPRSMSLCHLDSLKLMYS